MTGHNVRLAFNFAPLWILGGIAGAFLLLSIVFRVRDCLEVRKERAEVRKREKASGTVSLDAVPRREALALIEKLGAVRGRMLALDRALTQRREGVPWRFGIGDNADKFSRDADADSDVDQFLSGRTERDLQAAQSEMISLFRDAAKWLKKYAPEEASPPSVRERTASALQTFLGRFFPVLKQDADRKMIPVVEKTGKNETQTGNELPEKVTDGETSTDTAAGSGESPKSREKLRIPLELLKAGKPANLPDAAELRKKARSLSDTLRTYSIDVVPSGTPVAGPSVTRYEFRLQPGTKLKKLTNLADDIALSLGVGGVRIAPVPGKSSVIGIEAQNAKASVVALRDVLESRDFTYSPPSAFALGKDINGETVTADLDALPHVLIAGTTGSGKSVFLNSLIVSLLYKASPEELRLLLIDPKQVELTPYNGIPHLTQPVVTSSAQAVAALEQAAIGMDTRYKTFQNSGVKELSDYNRKAKSPLPRMVIVIDELSDLMMTSGKDIEESIVRIAQMGRAAGIHLVIATQRPSANVITGLMKANIPSRIAFAVASSLESRIILDANGAEKLTGHGDMLYAPVGGERKRVQGCYVSPEEIEKVVTFLKTK